MRNTIIYISFLIAFVQAYGQTKHKLKGKPTTLEETYKYLDYMFDDTTKYGFMSFPEDIATLRFHHGFGMWIRNNWGLWQDSKLKRYFLNNGVNQPDDMSAIILTSYHRHLNNRPIDFKEQIRTHQDFYKGMVRHGETIFFHPKDYFKNKTTDSELIKYFPIGDTILVSTYASYTKWFSTYASSVKAKAIVREHRADKLFLEIIAIENASKKKAERKVGDKYEEDPLFCSLIPPKGWAYKKL